MCNLRCADEVVYVGIRDIGFGPVSGNVCMVGFNLFNKDVALFRADALIVKFATPHVAQRFHNWPVPKAGIKIIFVVDIGCQ